MVTLKATTAHDRDKNKTPLAAGLLMSGLPANEGGLHG